MDIFYQLVIVKFLKREPPSHRIMHNARGGGLFNFFFKTSDQVSCYSYNLKIGRFQSLSEVTCISRVHVYLPTRATGHLSFILVTCHTKAVGRLQSLQTAIWFILESGRFCLI